MELVSVIQARVVTWISLFEINPVGRVPVFGFAHSLIERYGFAKAPKTHEEWTAQSGAEFAAGRLGDIEIIRLTLYGEGIVIDTRSSTDDSERVLEDMLAWGGTFPGFVRPPSNRRKWYSSELVFSSPLNLDVLHPALKLVGDRLSAVLAHDPRRLSPYETTGVIWNFEDSHLKVPPGSFRVERRAGVPFSDQKWWSQAPTPTSTHLEILQEFEGAVLLQERPS